MSLRLKLALTAALLTLGGVGVGLAITYGVLVTGANVSFDRESAILAEVIHEAVLLRGDTAIRVPAVVESYLTTESGVRSAQVFLDGQLLWEGGVLDGPRPLDPSGLVEGRGTRTVSGWRVVTLFDAGDGITVQVGRPLASMREALAPFGWLVLPLTLVLALVAGALAWLSAGLALRPLRVLTTAVTALDDVSEVPAITGSDEPAQLARAFRDLVERLRSQRQREHDFLAYAAHELRTPLSALRASLDAARSQDAGRLLPARWSACGARPRGSRRWRRTCWHCRAPKPPTSTVTRSTWPTSPPTPTTASSPSPSRRGSSCGSRGQPPSHAPTSACSHKPSTTWCTTRSAPRAKVA